jgi:hypothetical protein
MLTVGILTYGNRLSYVRKAVASSLTIPTSRVIIASNGCPVEVVDSLRVIASREPRVFVIELGSNLGSAGGYRAVIQSFCCSKDSGGDHLLLLDDDCVIEFADPDALQGLSPNRGYAIFRSDRRIMRRIAAGIPTSTLYPPVGSFLGFDPVFLLRKMISVRLRRQSGERILLEAPYSGLILSRAIIEAIGLPRLDFYLYGDDTEYTRRIVAKFGGIQLLSGVSIRELETSWNAGVGSNNFLLRLRRAGTSDRTFYSVRNGVYLDHVSASSSARTRLRFRLNRILYLSLFRIALRRDVYDFVREAVAKGEAEILGRRQ